ncbi:MAG: L,D-transpeptidase [Thermovirgaceae bacterium]|nr:L,D-transpeptidase [Thermovirgaceae bacterium]
MDKKIEREGTISTIRKHRLLPKLGLGMMILCALAFGVYIALDHGSPTQDAVAREPEEGVLASGAGAQAPPPLPGDPERLSAFVDEHALAGKFWLRLDKDSFSLSAWEGAKFITSYTVAVGENGGNKERVGDRRTPEGVFKVERIHDSRAWVHDFGDGKGPIEHAYGPWFIRLETGWKGIGIHGTHDPSTLGQMITEGCIRMNNEAILEIAGRAVPGTVVLIEP